MSRRATPSLWTNTMNTLCKIYLDESEMPTRWYNVVTVCGAAATAAASGQHQLATGEDFAVFPKA